MDVGRNSHPHRNWKDKKDNTRGSLQLGNSSVESSESHGNHTLGTRGFSCAVSGVGYVSIVTRAKNLWSRARFL